MQQKMLDRYFPRVRSTIHFIALITDRFSVLRTLFYFTFVDNTLLVRQSPLQLPDVSDIIRSVDELIAGNLMESMRRSKGAIDEVKQRVTDEIGDNVQRVKDALNEAGKAMQQLGTLIEKELMSVSQEAGTTSEDYLSQADYYLKEYGEYRYYAGLGISSLLLLILICVVCGLLCGICGKRPDGYGDDCCNKGAGGRFLMMYVWINRIDRGRQDVELI